MAATWNKRLLFGIATTVAFLVLLEAGSRLLGEITYPPDPLIAERAPLWKHNREYDPLLFWRLRPGSGVKEDIVNSRGLRGPEIPPKERDEFRVLSLGESTTYGWKVPYEQCYTALLERRLRESRNARIVNAGLPGYSIFQGRVFLEHRGLDLSPDAVLMYFGFNDFLNVAFREERDPLARRAQQGLTDRQLFAKRRAWPSRMSNRLYRHSNFCRWVGLRTFSATFASAEEGPIAVPGVRLAEDRVRVPEDDRWAALSEILEICRKHQIELVIVIPWYRDFEGHAPLLRRFAGEFDVALVDLPAGLESLSARMDEFFEDPAHPTAAGHGLIADHIWNVIGSRWNRGEVSDREPVDPAGP